MEGYVYEEDCATGMEPLQGVTVTAQHLATGQSYTAASAKNGRFFITIPLGHYKVTAERAGFMSVSQFSQADREQACFVEFRLQHIPPTYA
jgi:hypothetical protein